MTPSDRVESDAANEGRRATVAPFLLRIEDISKIFPRGIRAVDRLTLDLRENEYIVVVGPSGSGKTTLLRLIAGLERPTAGNVFLREKDITRAHPADRRMAMVFQQPALLPHLTVAGNVSFGFRASQAGRSEREDRIRAIAEAVSIDALLDRLPASLSGGERQRVSLAMALVSRPCLLLLDEPLSQLDVGSRESLRLLLKTLQGSTGTTFLHVTHDQEEALSLADRVVVLSEGRMVQVAPPERLYLQPANTFVARFIGSPPMNLVPGGLRRSGAELRFVGGGIDLAMPRHVHAALKRFRGESLLLGIRPEWIRLEDATTGHQQFQGVVASSQFRGDRAIHQIRLNEETVLTVSEPGGRALPVGLAVALHIDPGRIQCFSATAGMNVTVTP
jgi:multiple sugar transport system ATP-binding protein